MFNVPADRQNRARTHQFGGGVISLTLHAVGGLGVLAVLHAAPTDSSPRATNSVPTFVVVSLPSAMPHEPAAAPLPLVKPQEAPLIKSLDVSPALPDVAPRLAPERKTIAAESPSPIPSAPEPVLTVTPAAPSPQVTIGMFANSAPRAATLQASREVDRAGFDAPAAKTPDAKPGVTVTGGFDTTPSARATRSAGNLVTDSGFGLAAAAAAPASAKRIVRSAEFGDASDAPVRPAPSTAASLTQTVDTSVEVLSKPAPAYTDEARALKIEGEVLLDVEFGASGHVRVLGIKQGLGHGLDDAASRAAEQIQFKPARKNGQPVDFRATVHMTFRLT
jgi:TonB family protein